MKPITKSLLLGKITYYETHLSIINGLLPVKLTPKEIQVLAMFMSFEGDLAKDRFGTTARKMVKVALKLSDAGLSNYMKILSSKGYILGEDVLSIHPILSLAPQEQVYMFKITNKDYAATRV